jgi:UDP-GlcNAc:undecaprenyl-phosphate GlcNAc-1-phosphate transferase
VAYAIVFAVACGTTLVLTPLVRRLALRMGAIDQPSRDDRRVHAVATPTVGGLAMLGGALAGLAVAWPMGRFRDVFHASTEPLGVAVAALLIFGVGAIDDLRKTGVQGARTEGVSAPAKLAGTVLAGSVLSLAGISIIFFRVPFAGFFSLSPDLAALITVLWVVGMSHAVNLIDGLDGLAAGLIAIAAFAFFLYGVRLASPEVALLGPENISPLVSIIVVGVCVGFLPYNFHPARIFMGDSGALLLGLLMAAATMAVGGRTADQFSGQTYFFFAPLFIPLFILGVPILDTLFAIIRRASKRAGVATADKDHLHHRLMRLGHGQRRSVVILWTWTALLSGFVLYPTYTGKGDGIVPLGVLALGLALYMLFHPGVRRAREAVENGAGAGAAQHDEHPEPTATGVG